MKLPFRPGVHRSSFEIDMTNGPLVGKIIKFAVPLALSGILQLLFNAADIVVAGRFAGSHYVCLYAVPAFLFVSGA